MMHEWKFEGSGKYRRLVHRSEHGKHRIYAQYSENRWDSIYMLAIPFDNSEVRESGKIECPKGISLEAFDLIVHDFIELFFRAQVVK